jgi:hypothetical protein
MRSVGSSIRTSDQQGAIGEMQGEENEVTDKNGTQDGKRKKREKVEASRPKRISKANRSKLEATL